MDFSKIDMGEFGRHLFGKILKATASDGSFAEMINQMKNNKKKYTDESFPPDEHSLINDWEDDEAFDKVRDWKKFTWVRASEMEELNDAKEGKLEIFKQKVEPSDIA